MKKSILKTGSVEIQTIIDKETGEILSSNTKKHTYITHDKETFFIGYSSLIGAFMEMTQAEVRTFGYCLRFARGVHFDISKNVRNDIAKFTGLNERTVLNTLPALLEKKLLFKHTSNLYQLNPRYAFEGSVAERNNSLKILIELGCKNC